MSDIVEEFPNTPVNSDRVFFMRDKAERICNNYNTLLEFAAYILQVPKGAVKTSMLKMYANSAKDESRQLLKNLSFPVDYYLQRNQSLQEEIQSLRKRVEELEGALREVSKEAVLLLNHAEHAAPPNTIGPPMWLVDCRDRITKARAALEE